MGCSNSSAKQANTGEFTNVAGVDTPVTNKAAEKIRIKGNAEFSKQNYDGAIKLYSDALSIDPTEYRYVNTPFPVRIAYDFPSMVENRCLCNRSACHAEKGQWTKALEDAQDCIKCRPDFPKGYMRAGYALKALKRSSLPLASAS
jgi:stress-induced-phosphoprotein 1